MAPRLLSGPEAVERGGSLDQRDGCVPATKDFFLVTAMVSYTSGLSPFYHGKAEQGNRIFLLRFFPCRLPPAIARMESIAGLLHCLLN